MFWSEIGSGFGEPGGTPLSKIPRSNPPGSQVIERLPHHKNLKVSQFQLKRLSTSGDISLNPGPERCATCTKTLAKNNRKLRCNCCSGLHHIKCGQVKPTEFKRKFQPTNTTWICPQCVAKSLLAELPMAGDGDTSFESLFLDEEEGNVTITNSYSETQNGHHANDPSSRIITKRQKNNGSLLIMHLKRGVNRGMQIRRSVII